MGNATALQRGFTILLTIIVGITLSFSASLVLPCEEAHAVTKTPAKVKSVKVSKKTTTSAKVSWSKTSHAKKYQVAYKKASSSKWIYKTTKSKSITLKGLSNNTKYQVKVSALNGSKEGSWSSTKTFSTTAKTPSKVSGLKTSSVSKNSFKVSWSKASYAKKYQVAYKKFSSSKWTYKTTTSKSSTLKSLSANTKYNIKVRAINTGTTTKYGSWSSIKTVTTAKASASSSTANSGSLSSTTSTTSFTNLAPTSLWVSGSECDMNQMPIISLGWSSVSGATKYEVYRSAKDENSYKKIGTTTSLSYQDTSASKGTKYYYKVRAIDKSGSASKFSSSDYEYIPYAYELYVPNYTDLYDFTQEVSPYCEKYGNGTTKTRYESSQYIMVMTDNPDADVVYFGLESRDKTKKSLSSSFSTMSAVKDYKTLEFPARPSELRDYKFADLESIPDKTADGKYIYILRCEFKSGAGAYKVGIKEEEAIFDGYSHYLGRPANTWTLDVKSYKETYLNWLDDVIDEYTTPSMNNHEKMQAITDGLRAKATYNYYTLVTEKYSSTSSFRIDAMHKWETYYWDSGYLAPMQDIGAKLGYQVQNYAEAGKSEGMHSYVWGTYDGTEYKYHICPSMSTSPDLCDYCPQMSLSDFAKVNKN